MNEEEKKAIEKFVEKCNKFDESVEIKGISVGEEYRMLNTVCKALNLIEKLQKENIEQKAEIERRKHDNKTLKEFVSAVFNEELNNKYILTDKQNNAVIENAQNDINQKWIQKVQDKIEEKLKQEKEKYGNCLIKMYEDELVNRDIKILQELIEERKKK